MATYAIGDVQGCYDSLCRLLEKVHFSSTDKLWFAGDLVNRGPQSLETLRFIHRLASKPIVVLGNHDLHLLAVAHKKAARRKQDTFQTILRAPDREELLHWLQHRSLLHHDNKLGFTMVHAGLPPQWDLDLATLCAAEVTNLLRSEKAPTLFEKMYGNSPKRWREELKGWPRIRFIINCFTQLRFCNAEGKLEMECKGDIGSAPHGYMPWFKVPHRQHQDLKILFGHWAALAGKADTPSVWALDTGCAWGNCLTAMRLEDTKLFSVKCK